MDRLLEKTPPRNVCVPIRWSASEAEMVEYGAWMDHIWSRSQYMRDIVLDHIRKRGVPEEYQKYLERRANCGKDEDVAVKKS